MTPRIQSRNAHCRGSHGTSGLSTHEILKYDFALKSRIQGVDNYVQMVICRSWELFCWNKETIWGGTASRGRILQGMESARNYNDAGYSNPRPKYLLLVLCAALFIMLVNDTRGSDYLFKAGAIPPLHTHWRPWSLSKRDHQISLSPFIFYWLTQ